jgi:hypothetical protein
LERNAFGVRLRATRGATGYASEFDARALQPELEIRSPASDDECKLAFARHDGISAMIQHEHWRSQWHPSAVMGATANCSEFAVADLLAVRLLACREPAWPEHVEGSNGRALAVESSEKRSSCKVKATRRHCWTSQQLYLVPGATQKPMYDWRRFCEAKFSPIIGQPAVGQRQSEVKYEIEKSRASESRT